MNRSSSSPRHDPTDAPQVARRRCTALLLWAALPGCGALRSGWESVAYVGPPPAVPERHTGEWRSALDLPGLVLRVWLDNSEQIDDSKRVLGVVPAGSDRTPLRTPGASSGRTGIELWATPHEPGFVFEPRAAVLGIGPRRVQADDGGASVPFRLRPDGRYTGEPPAAAPVPGQVALPSGGHTVRLALGFAVPAPSPQRDDLVLDLAAALRCASVPPLPLIRFRPGRWAVGYT